ncbi:MAG: hypothetical protein CSA58_12340 [Micrococcales bacterium]|nr:MAG: hypothetical protein CSA58_12340 [Micrococcales bacterium]
MLSGRGAAAPAEPKSQTWKARLARAVSFVSPQQAHQYLTKEVTPALTEVAEELTAREITAKVHSGVAEDDTGTAETGESPKESAEGTFVELRTEAPEHPFVYRVQVSSSPVPTYGGRMLHPDDTYARLEVHLGEGGQGYDVMGYSRTQIIHDVLDQYERHLEFLRLG